MRASEDGRYRRRRLAHRYGFARTIRTWLVQTTAARPPRSAALWSMLRENAGFTRETTMAELEAPDQFALGVARQSWDLFKRDPLMFVMAGAVMLIGSGVSLGLLAGPLHVGFIELCRRARRGEPVSVGILFSRFDSLVASLVAFTIIFLGVLIGFFLLVIPGLVVGVFSMFTLHAITYENLGGIDAIRRSIGLVRSNLVPALVLLIMLAVVQSIGGVVIFGVLLTMPLAIIGLTVGYERITGVEPAYAVV
ncbi:MAG: hypothetical protein JWN48_2097 [Myxococcaceae bacterium]|nr:hypothetical protein [Myxococcaceae bacterium]